MDFDCGLFRPPLRASLEPGVEHPVETVRLSSRPKPATKVLLWLQVLIHRFREFVNYGGQLKKGFTVDSGWIALVGWDILEAAYVASFANFK